MGILTNISEEYDDRAEVQRIFAVTKFSINTRSSLNRVAGRAAAGSGVGQRTLVSAAYGELGIDLVFKRGLFDVVDPEEEYEDAKKINFKSVEMESASKFGDILTARLQDRVEFENYRPDSVLNIWEIPYEVTDHR